MLTFFSFHVVSSKDDNETRNKIIQSTLFPSSETRTFGSHSHARISTLGAYTDSVGVSIS